MRPRHVKLRQDARGHDGEGEECGDHRRTDPDTCESDFTANARGSRRGSAKVREPGRCAITRRRSCRAGGAIDFRCADRPLRGARRGYGRGHLREHRTSGDDGAPPCRETPNPESSTLPSVARPSGTSPDPRLCVPASRQVCRYREGVSVRSTGCEASAEPNLGGEEGARRTHGPMGTSAGRGPDCDGEDICQTSLGQHCDDRMTPRARLRSRASRMALGQS